MGRNSEFDLGRFSIKYSGESLFHGSPETLNVGDVVTAKNSEEHNGINTPVAWATTSHQDAKAQGDYHEAGNSTVYTVEPVNAEETHGIPSGRIYPGQKGINTHFISKHGFKVTGVHK